MRPPALHLTKRTERLLRPALAGLDTVVIGPQNDPAAWSLRLSDGRPFDGWVSMAAAWNRWPYTLVLKLSRWDAEVRKPVTISEIALGTHTRRMFPLRARIGPAVREMLEAARSGYVKTTQWDTPALPSPRFLPMSLYRGAILHVAQWCRDVFLAERWGVGIIGAPLIETALRSSGVVPQDIVTWLETGALGSLADPFPWPGVDALLCEQLPATPDGLGTLIAVKQNGSTIIEPPRPILAGDRHRSYPGAFVHEGQTYLLPETPHRGETTLYRLAKDGALSPVCPIDPQRAMADPSFFQHRGLCWIAFTDLDLDPHDNLCLLHAPRPSGPWRGHPGNPVKVDIRSARPAGAPIWYKDVLLRPAQDCSGGYGGAVVINRVDSLTLDAFQETPIRRLSPDPRGPYPHGLHTLTGDNKRSFVDGRKLEFQPRWLLAKLRRRLSAMVKKRS